VSWSRDWAEEMTGCEKWSKSMLRLMDVDLGELGSKLITSRLRIVWLENELLEHVTSRVEFLRNMHIHERNYEDTAFPSLAYLNIHERNYEDTAFPSLAYLTTIPRATLEVCVQMC